jgi:hypothetical protein
MAVVSSPSILRAGTNRGRVWYIDPRSRTFPRIQDMQEAESPELMLPVHASRRSNWPSETEIVDTEGSLACGDHSLARADRRRGILAA